MYTANATTTIAAIISPIINQSGSSKNSLIEPMKEDSAGGSSSAEGVGSAIVVKWNCGLVKPPSGSAAVTRHQ